MDKKQIDIFNELGDLLYSLNSDVIPRKGDEITIIDRTSEQNPDNQNPGGTDKLRLCEVKTVEIVYCKYGETFNDGADTPIINITIK